MGSEQDVKKEIAPLDNQLMVFTYRNHEGKVAVRKVRPNGTLWFGKTKWHPEEQWFLPAYDTERKAMRDFAFKDIMLTDPLNINAPRTGRTNCSRPNPSAPPRREESSYTRIKKISSLSEINAEITQLKFKPDKIYMSMDNIKILRDMMSTPFGKIVEINEIEVWPIKE